jgi:hypothetical protein
MKPTPAEKKERPVRIGVFSDINNAEDAVRALLAAGFTQSQITVVCSDKTVQHHFERFHHRDPAGTHTAATAMVGGGIGALLGGVTAAAIGAATGGVALLAAGGLALGAGGVVGTLIGALMSRGVEEGIADYYDQAVQAGKILVAVEAHGDNAVRSLADAERIFADNGVEPLPLAKQ